MPGAEEDGCLWLRVPLELRRGFSVRGRGGAGYVQTCIGCKGEAPQPLQPVTTVQEALTIQHKLGCTTALLLEAWLAEDALAGGAQLVGGGSVLGEAPAEG